ncbi:MAG: hypothetical protein HZB39_08400 [Planctomycetes bacterium]|nr:hypothetical protein [Planctomycetota bacterium]
MTIVLTGRVDRDDGSGAVASVIAQALPPGHDLLLSSLARLKRAWLPAERARLVESLRDCGQALAPAVAWVIVRPSHPLHREVAEFAQLLADRSVLEIAPETVLDPEAMEATADVAALPDDGDRGRAVGFSGSASEAGVTPDDPQTGVDREHDGSIDEAGRNDLIRSLSDARVRHDAAAMLSRTALTPEELERILERFRGSLRSGELWSFEALGCLGKHPQVAEFLWQFAIDETADSKKRLESLHALDAAGIGAERLPSGYSDWSPAMRFVAARMLSRSGDARAASTLLALADPEDPANDAALRHAARVMLAGVLAVPPHTSLAALRALVDRGDVRIEWIETPLPRL